MPTSALRGGLSREVGPDPAAPLDVEDVEAEAQEDGAGLRMRILCCMAKNMCFRLDQRGFCGYGAYPKLDPEQTQPLLTYGQSGAAEAEYVDQSF
ncbi:hypothetical protein NDU88_005178 [Pleurodeles waltl]|uniref:Uncharacterized protein n=1 Tax=Pleurodeles waltl TaxID=8319 RepID=A0AAV7RNC9_PLEWA|nr:hypothetical protein NDU88_005178 [Pleurodeles waltl]